MRLVSSFFRSTVYKCLHLVPNSHFIDCTDSTKVHTKVVFVDPDSVASVVLVHATINSHQQVRCLVAIHKSYDRPNAIRHRRL